MLTEILDMVVQFINANYSVLAAMAGITLALWIGNILAQAARIAGDFTPPTPEIRRWDDWTDWESQTPVIPAQPEAWKCEYCGKKNRPDADECAGCSAQK